MSILDGAVSRAPLGEHDGRSGGSLERVVLADGRRLVVKHSSWATDLTRRLTGDIVGREYTLWRHGGLVRHAIIDGWLEGTDTVVVMHDLGGSVVGWDRVLSRAEVVRLLTAARAVHRLDAPRALLVPLEVRVGAFTPARMEPLAAEFPLAAIALDGWSRFADLGVPSSVLALLDDPAPLAAALAERPCTMIHGDLWPVNTALPPGSEAVLLDWNMAGWAPPACDLAALLAAAGSAHLAISREAVIEEFRVLSGPRYDERALRLALLAGLIDFGWNKALDATTGPDQERHRADLAWWLAQAHHGLQAIN